MDQSCHTNSRQFPYRINSTDLFYKLKCKVEYFPKTTENKSKGPEKRKELRKLTWLLCTFPDSAGYPFLHGGRRDSWLPRENTRECDPARAWKTCHQQTSQQLQESPGAGESLAESRCSAQLTLSGRVANVTGLRCSIAHVKVHLQCVSP